MVAGLLKVSFLSSESLQAGEFGSDSTGDGKRHVVIKRLQVWLALLTTGCKNVSPRAEWAAVEFAFKLPVWSCFAACKHTLRIKHCNGICMILFIFI